MSSNVERPHFSAYIAAFFVYGVPNCIYGGKNGIKDIPIEYISYDSRDVKPGTLFICKGAAFKEEYLEEAIEKGAVAYLIDEKSPYAFKPSPDLPVGKARNPRGVIEIQVKNLRLAISLVVDTYYESVWQKLYIAAVTGTKGKSTTVYMLKAIMEDYLEDEGEPGPAILSSIDTYDGVISEESHLTTPEPIELYKHFQNAVDSGIRFLLMEASSQALKYERLSYVQFTATAFLNIGKDHISEAEHSDFDDYFNSKLKIFEHSNGAFISSSMDEKYFGKAMIAADKAGCIVYTFGFKEEDDFYAHDIVPEPDGVRFKVKVKRKDIEDEIKLAMTGIFNVENALAAMMLASAYQVPYGYIKSGLERALVPGRMEVFRGAYLGKPLTAIVDYAHNEMSFNALFDSVAEEYPNAEVSIVFGCPGGKAFNRREELARIAALRADKIYITEEDPGEEDVSDICREIERNVEKTLPTRQCRIIVDREEAIRTAIDEAARGGVVLITAKGRETRQKRGREYVPCRSDVEIVEELI